MRAAHGIYVLKYTSKKGNFTNISAIWNISSVDFYRGWFFFAKWRIILCYAISGLKFIGKYEGNLLAILWKGKVETPIFASRWKDLWHGSEIQWNIYFSGMRYHPFEKKVPSHGAPASRKEVEELTKMSWYRFQNFNKKFNVLIKKWPYFSYFINAIWNFSSQIIDLLGVAYFGNAKAYG